MRKKLDISEDKELIFMNKVRICTLFNVTTVTIEVKVQFCNRIQVNISLQMLILTFSMIIIYLVRGYKNRDTRGI